jgi:hypothetical protein
MLPQNQRRQSARLKPVIPPPPPSPRGITASNTAERRRQRARGSQRQTKAQRVDEICQFMRKKDITLREFIQVYVTTQGSGGYGERPATRAKRLAEAIYGQVEVLDALRDHPASGTAGIVTVKALRKEIKALEQAGEMFSAYRVDRVQQETAPTGLGQEEQTVGGQKLEDYEVILGDMQFGQMCEEVNTRAPMLGGLLSELMAPKMERKDRAPRDPFKFNHRIAIITSISAILEPQKGATNFPASLVLFFTLMG